MRTDKSQIFTYMLKFIKVLSIMIQLIEYFNTYKYIRVYLTIFLRKQLMQFCRKHNQVVFQNYYFIYVDTIAIE